MTRRELLTSLLIPVGISCADHIAGAQTRRRRAVRHAAAGPLKLDRVGVSSSSFRNSFPTTRDAATPVRPANLALLDFPPMIADRYKVHILEIAARHFASVEPSYLLELKSSLLRARSRVVNLALDIRELESGGGLSDAQSGNRENAIAAAKRWIDIARQLGARSVSCNPGGYDANSIAVTLDSYRQLNAYGRAKRVAVLIDSRGGAGFASPEAVVSLCRGVGGPFIGALPDFGAFPDDATRMRVLPMLCSYARSVCHATGVKLDANGKETAFNFPQCVRITQNSGFRGTYAVNYEGDADPYAVVQEVVNELLAVL